jgi:hypothetical protein
LTHSLKATGFKPLHINPGFQNVPFKFNLYRYTTAVISRLESAGGTRAWDAHLMAALEGEADWTEYGVYAAGTCLAGLLDKV